MALHSAYKTTLTLHPPSLIDCFGGEKVERKRRESVLGDPLKLFTACLVTAGLLNHNNNGAIRTYVVAFLRIACLAGWEKKQGAGGGRRIPCRRRGNMNAHECSPPGPPPPASSLPPSLTPSPLPLPAAAGPHKRRASRCSGQEKVRPLR